MAHDAGKPSSRREQLLDQAADYVTAHGLQHASIRELAAELGVAHNSLTHHFGARAELLAAIFDRLAERARGAALRVARSGDPRAGVNSTWTAITDPVNRQMWTTFFEVYAAALRDPSAHQAFLSHVARDWSGPLTELMVGAGMPGDVAAARATLVVATVRGLLLDQLAGGDTRRIDAARELLLEQVDAWRPR